MLFNVVIVYRGKNCKGFPCFVGGGETKILIVLWIIVLEFIGSMEITFSF